MRFTETKNVFLNGTFKYAPDVLVRAPDDVYIAPWGREIIEPMRGVDHSLYNFVAFYFKRSLQTSQVAKIIEKIKLSNNINMPLTNISIYDIVPLVLNVVDMLYPHVYDMSRLLRSFFMKSYNGVRSHDNIKKLYFKIMTKFRIRAKYYQLITD